MLGHESSANTVGYNTAVKQTIYSVEDDTDISRLVRHHLEAAGYGVRSFPSTAGVITEAEKQSPALFLLDIMLPGGDGLELCRRIRQTPALSMIPVIFLTAKTTESDKVIGLELGADDYLTKPFGLRELMSRIKALLRRAYGDFADAGGGRVLRHGGLIIRHELLALRLNARSGDRRYHERCYCECELDHEILINEERWWNPPASIARKMPYSVQEQPASLERTSIERYLPGAAPSPNLTVDAHSSEKAQKAVQEQRLSERRPALRGRTRDRGHQGRGKDLRLLRGRNNQDPRDVRQDVEGARTRQNMEG